MAITSESVIQNQVYKTHHKNVRSHEYMFDVEVNLNMNGGRVFLSHVLDGTAKSHSHTHRIMVAFKVQFPIYLAPCDYR